MVYYSIINRVDLVRFVDLGYQIFFLAVLGLGYVDTCYPSENGSSAGFPDPKLTPSQPLLWKWHFLPDLGANLENLGSRLRLVTFMAWSCASTWKNMPGGVKPIFTAIGPGKCQKNGPKTTLQKLGRAANENNKCSIFFLPSGSGLSRPTYRNHIWTQFLHKKSGQIEITWLFTFFHTVFSSFLLT